MGPWEGFVAPPRGNSGGGPAALGAGREDRSKVALSRFFASPLRQSAKETQEAVCPQRTASPWLSRCSSCSRSVAHSQDSTACSGGPPPRPALRHWLLSPPAWSN